MKRVLVSLVSEQTVPNILAIHHFEPDELLFVTTKDMEEKHKTDAIIATLKRLGLDYQTSSTRIAVQQDSILGCHRKLGEWIEGNEGCDFLVNLTGGTKIMSIAAYEFFKDYGSRMMYIPLSKNEFVSPFPKRSAALATPLRLRLSVPQYLTAYGLDVVNEKKLKGYGQEASERGDLSKWMVVNYRRIKNLLKWLAHDDKGGLRKHRDDRQYRVEGEFLDPTEEEKTLLERLGFARTRGRIARTLFKSETRYLTGGWLEEFCYNEVCAASGAGVDDAVVNPEVANIHGQRRNNEFDVLFTKDNALFTIECKSLGQDEDKRTDILYKIAALQKDFGLRAASFLVSTSDHILRDGKISPHIAARAEQFGTLVIPPHQVESFGTILAERLQIRV